MKGGFDQMEYRSVVTTYKKVSGWSAGPSKPTTTVTTGTAGNVKDAITSAVAVANINALAKGESIQITVTSITE
jgi:hypothetical protein